MRQLIKSLLVKSVFFRLFGAKPLSEPTLTQCQLDLFQATYFNRILYWKSKVFSQEIHLKMSSANGGHMISVFVCSWRRAKMVNETKSCFQLHFTDIWHLSFIFLLVQDFKLVELHYFFSRVTLFSHEYIFNHIIHISAEIRSYLLSPIIYYTPCPTHQKRKENIHGFKWRSKSRVYSKKFLYQFCPTLKKIWKWKKKSKNLPLCCKQK